MAKEHLAAGTEVKPGIYRCNACANKHECRAESERLPRCQVCDSISWRTYRLTEKSAGENVKWARDKDGRFEPGS